MDLTLNSIIRIWRAIPIARIIKIRNLLMILIIIAMALPSASPKNYGMFDKEYWDTISGSQEGYPDGGGSPTTKWYDVAPWEIDFCSKWGGSKAPNDNLPGTRTSDQPFSNMAATYQAQSDFIELPDKTTLYEYSYYIEPARGHMEYTIELRGGIDTYLLEKGNASAAGGAANYNAVYLNGTFTQMVIKYEKCGICSPSQGTFPIANVQDKRLLFPEEYE